MVHWSYIIREASYKRFHRNNSVLGGNRGGVGVCGNGMF